jgi:hypothetical protein
MSGYSFLGCEVRKCKGVNAYCKMCYPFYQDGRENIFLKGQMVMEIATKSPQGYQKTLLCEKHARIFSAQMSEEVKKFDIKE